MMGRFVRAIDVPRGGDFMETSILSEDEKELLCRDLLDEFGVENLTHNESKGELVHSCVLPFGMHAHGDRNPSASLNYKKLTYSCYSCGGGGFLWFIATCRGTNTEEAKSWLGQQSGTGADEQGLEKLLQFIDSVYAKGRVERDQIPTLDSRVLDQWLCVHPYMTEIRKMPEDNLCRFKVGYGSLRIRIGDDHWVDSERIVIPHFWRGDLVGWQSRRLFQDDGTARYLSTPHFPKDVTIFNYEPSERVVVVESPMSVLKHDHAIHMEATFGAMVTEPQMRYLADHPGPVVLWFDNDAAGWLATHKLAESLSSYVPVYVVSSSWAADPADMDTAMAQELIDGAVPYALWRQPSELLALEAA